MMESIEKKKKKAPDVNYPTAYRCVFRMCLVKLSLRVKSSPQCGHTCSPSTSPFLSAQARWWARTCRFMSPCPAVLRSH